MAENYVHDNEKEKLAQGIPLLEFKKLAMS
jgi:hypothetical protein